MRHQGSIIAILMGSIMLAAACAPGDGDSSQGEEQGVVGEAQQALSPTRTPWEMHNGLEVTSGNPNGLLPFSCAPGTHGANCEYDVVCNTSPVIPPCLTQIPPAGNAGWGPAPNGNTIGFSIPSRVCAAPITCMAFGDFTYFQTFVDVPVGSTVTQFSIAFSGMDDGSRITIFNSAYPFGIVVPGSYVYLGGSGTSNLQSYIVSGEVNRVVVTQVDDCCSANNLQSAVVVLNGTSVQTAVCGNGIVEAGEACDDHNTVNGDGCSSTCAIENPVCGNGHLEPGEQCDDGNTVDNDGCSAGCKVEHCTAIRRGAGNVEDAWIAANDASTNYGASGTLTTGGLPVGKALLKFDVSGIPSTATITKGFLRLAQTYAGTSGVDAHLITGPWSESSVTFTSFGNAFNPTPFTSEVVGGGPIPPIYFDIVSTLQGWVDGSIPNHGVLLGQGLTGQHIFRSSEDATSAFRPVIQFCYTN